MAAQGVVSISNILGYSTIQVYYFTKLLEYCTHCTPGFVPHGSSCIEKHYVSPQEGFRLALTLV